MLTDGEIDRIAAAMTALRPDWPAKSVRTLIETKLKHRTRRDVAVALTWVACDSTTITPARVLEAGPWWFGFNQETRVARNPRPDEECPLHVGQYRSHCSGCAVEHLDAGPTARRVTSTPPSPDYLAARKAQR